MCLCGVFVCALCVVVSFVGGWGIRDIRDIVVVRVGRVGIDKLVVVIVAR